MSPSPSAVPLYSARSYSSLQLSETDWWVARTFFCGLISIDWAEGVNCVLSHFAPRDRTVCAERWLGRIRHSVDGFENRWFSTFRDVQARDTERTAARTEQGFIRTAEKIKDETAF